MPELARPAIRMLRPAALIGAIAIGVLALTGPAAAAEGEVDVSLNGLNSSLTAGRTDNFSVRLENQTDQILTVRRVIIVQLDGLTADGVRVARNFELPKDSSSPGTVRFVDQLQEVLGPEGRQRSSRTVTYQIQFTSAAPTGQAEVTVEAYSGDQRLGADSDGVNVKTGNGQTTDPDRTTTPPTTHAPVTVPPQSGSAESLAPLNDNNRVAGVGGEGSGVPTILYVLGGALVVVGGVILWLLFRGPRHDEDPYPTGGYEPVRPPTLGYPSGPRGAAAMNPTAVLPVVRDPMNRDPMNRDTVIRDPRVPVRDPRALPPPIDHPWTPHDPR